MARLIETVREKDIQTDTLLMLIERRRFIQPASKNANKREISGWLKEASDLRNCFIHRRPYGARHAERFGHVAAIAIEAGLYRYVRPVLVEGNVEQDILDVVVSHYKQATALFQEAAEISGRDISTITITDKDIISIRMG